ncbi:FG-GAP-like repeat-containing protein [Streptomyces marincola]|uniref:FG-GAP-like repeat-containing protein n=1 Tax=Streptomyces marincola TaxID=2878388 RepID=UPI001CF27536|nr:FG-GAP-like repeat-containing protein [Streptomyces marincola]UCM90452.1 FG-GAP-like repeat-containing protein [Streptomyces marincola]
MRALIAVSAILMSLLSVVGAAASPASAAGLQLWPVITNNLQGATSGGDSKWSTSVAGFARAAEIVALQEAGPEPPGSGSIDRTVINPNAPGNSGFVQHRQWTPFRESYEVYFLQTDSAGGSYVGNRNNLAIVTQRPADEVTIVTNPNPAGRNALGVRFGDNWYFSYHALSGGGVDAPAMLDAIANFVNNQGQNRTWTVLGDFNRDPDSFFRPPQTWLYRTHEATHQNGQELDYAVSSENIPDHPVARLPGASPDHYAVAIGAMRAAAEPPELRILPFGDSITFGAGSTTAAYRGPLLDELRQWENTTVNYVGSQRYGNIPDNENEGHPNWKINDLIGITDSVMDTYKPNVVLLHIGTNDMNEAIDPVGAPDRLGSLMDRIFAKQPDVTLIVSTLVPSAYDVTEQRIVDFNRSLPQEVYERQRDGKRVWLVDNFSALDEASDLADLLHPSDDGYRKMGEVFYEGIEAAASAGWISPPATSPGGGTGGPVRGWVPQGTVASGTMAPVSAPGSLSLSGGDRVHYADINGDGRADFIVSREVGEADVWFNGGVNTDGTITWNHSAQKLWGLPAARWSFVDVYGDGRVFAMTVAPREGPNGEMVDVLYGAGSQFRHQPRSSLNINHRFADIDGDGAAEWLQVYPNSSVEAIRHEPGVMAPWTSEPQVVASGVGEPGGHVRFADINGDGRADYLVVDPDGTVQAWLGGGPKPEGGDYVWRPQGTIATGLRSPSSQIQFADLDGDGRADLLDVNPATGETWLWRNGGQPAGPGWTWQQQGSITAANTSQAVYADINGDGRADYLQINADSSVQAWLGGGPKPEGGDWYWAPQGTIAGGVGARGRNVRFTDLNGDGRADYVVVNADSSVQAWINGGPNPGGGDWYWIPQGTIAGGVGVPGGNVRLADLNGDGRADYVAVNDNSSVQAWINGGPKPEGGDWYWAPQGTIAGGVGAPGRNVRFADLTGDGRADYLVVHANSAVDLWANGGPKPEGGDWYWAPQGTTASGVGVPGGRIQFADIDADRREDYLDVDPRSGATRAWINFG